MRIIAYSFTYNERRLIPWHHHWMKSQGIEMFVIDNLSTDGTKQYLEQNNIRHCSVDTGGSFDLRPLLSRMTEQIRVDCPDWFIYSTTDMFFVARNYTIAELIMQANTQTYSMIALPQYTFYHTTNPPKTINKNIPNPFLYNFYYRFNNVYSFISAFHYDVIIEPDKIKRPPCKIMHAPDAAILEMNAAKTIEERMENLIRRKKAWQQGLSKTLGYHYRILAERGFIYPEHEQTDIRTQPQLLTLFNKLQSIHAPY